MNSIRPRGALVHLFLVDGTPQGLRKATRVGSTICCLAFSRADYSEVRRRPEMRQTGAYLLVGSDPEGLNTTRVYVGEGDEVLARIDSHHGSKDFWSTGHVLTTTDNSLNKAQVRYVESRLLELARTAGTATLDNATAPATTWLSEADQVPMEAFIEEALLLLPLLGVHAFDVVVGQAAPEVVGLPDALSNQSGGGPEEPGIPGRRVPEREPELGSTRLYLRLPNTVATAQETPRGFVVDAGATARREKKEMQPGYERIRARLIDKGELVPRNDLEYELVRATAFDAPSAAAAVLSASSVNGRTAWKTADGRTLRELQESLVSTRPEPSEITAPDAPPDPDRFRF